MSKWLRYQSIEEHPQWLFDGAKVWVYTDELAEPMLCTFDEDSEEFESVDGAYTCLPYDVVDGSVSFFEIYLHPADVPSAPVLNSAGDVVFELAMPKIDQVLLSVLNSGAARQVLDNMVNYGIGTETEEGKAFELAFRLAGMWPK